MISNVFGRPRGGSYRRATSVVASSSTRTLQSMVPTTASFTLPTPGSRSLESMIPLTTQLQMSRTSRSSRSGLRNAAAAARKAAEEEAEQSEGEEEMDARDLYPPADADELENLAQLRRQQRARDAAEFEGADLGAKRVKKDRYRDYAFPEPSGGRYVYRLYQSGTLYIVEHPKRGVYPAGKEVLVAAGTRAHDAIMGAIQALRAGKRADTIRSFAQVASAVATGVSAGTRKTSAAEPPTDEWEDTGIDASARSTSDVPWAAIGVSIAAALALVVALK